MPRFSSSFLDDLCVGAVALGQLHCISLWTVPGHALPPVFYLYKHTHPTIVLCEFQDVRQHFTTYVHICIPPTRSFGIYSLQFRTAWKPQEAKATSDADEVEVF